MPGSPALPVPKVIRLALGSTCQHCFFLLLIIPLYEETTFNLPVY